jgi:hypothetical protein
MDIKLKFLFALRKITMKTDDLSSFPIRFWHPFCIQIICISLAET